MISTGPSTEPMKPSQPPEQVSPLFDALASSSVILLEVKEGTAPEIVDQALRFMKTQLPPGQEIAVVYVEDK